MKKLLQRIFSKSKSIDTEIVDLEIGNGWQQFDNGKTIGKKGSENGKIIFDQENQDGARITLEQNANSIPYAITLGIYGLMFHTEFLGELKSATEYIEKKKIEIVQILKMYEVEENQRNSNWNDEHNLLLENLVYK